MTTVPERITALRDAVKQAQAAAAAARTARAGSREAARLGGELAPRRAAADSEVAMAARRARQLSGLRPQRWFLTLRGRGRQERDARQRTHQAALAHRDQIVAESSRLCRTALELAELADREAARAATLPRLLDELAALLRHAGGDHAVRLAEVEARLEPGLRSEIECSLAVQAVDRACRRLRELTVQLVTAAARSGSDAAVAARIDAITHAVLILRRDLSHPPDDLRAATDAWLRWSAGPDGREGRELLDRVGTLVRGLDDCAEALVRERSLVRHEVARTRAVQLDILRGVAA